MKKVLFFATAIAVLSLSSCKKTSTCDYGDGYKTECTKCAAALTKTFKSACETGGGTYSK